jgi:hypothetical protein
LVGIAVNTYSGRESHGLFSVNLRTGRGFAIGCVGIAGCVDAFLKQRVDKGCGGGTRQEEQRAEEQHHDYNWREPPFLIVPQKVPEFTDDTWGGLPREFFKVALLHIQIEIGRHWNDPPAE